MSPSGRARFVVAGRFHRDHEQGVALPPRGRIAAEVRERLRSEQAEEFAAFLSIRRD